MPQRHMTPAGLRVHGMGKMARGLAMLQLCVALVAASATPVYVTK